MGSLTDYLQGGWSAVEPFPGLVGHAPTLEPVLYYQHNGYVYLTGEVTNKPPGADARYTVGGQELSLIETEQPWPAVGATILSGFPSELCPSADVSIVLPINPARTTDPAWPALNLPGRYHTTMHPDGTWTFDDALPEYLNAPPPAAQYWFWGQSPGEGGPLVELPQYPNPLILALVIGNARWPVGAAADTYSSKTAVPFLSGQFGGNPTYTVHGNRVHIGGGATAHVQGAYRLLTNGPPGCYAAVEEGEAADVGEPTTAIGPSGVVPLVAIASTLQVLSDQPIHRATESPPLTISSPAAGHGYYRGGGGRQYNIQTLAAEPEFSDSAPSGAGIISFEEIVDGPDYECVYKLGPLDKGTHVYCKGAAPLPALSFDVATLLAQFYPQPPWFELSLFFFGTAPGESRTVLAPWPELTRKDLADDYRGQRGSSGCFNYAGIHDPIGCTFDINVLPWWTISGAALPAGEPDAQIAKRATEKGITAGEVEGPEYGGPILAADGSRYKGVALVGEEKLPLAEQLATRLWTPDQATVVGVHPTGEIGRGLSQGFLFLTPYYEKRQFGLRSGDALDLSKTGWRSGAGEMNIGPGAKGIVPREG